MKPVYVDVAELLKKPGEEILFSGPVQLDPVRLGQEQIEFEGPFAVGVRLSNAGQGVLIKGSADGSLRLQCSRCLEWFAHPVRLEIDEVAVARDDARKDGLFPIEEKKIDLVPVVYENALLAVPIKPLHRPDCAGLCAVCGKNLNEEPHTHETEEIDERLAPLKDFFKKKP
jgi:uncharacterized protein